MSKLNSVTAVEGDYLVYATSNYSGESQLMVFDPAKENHTQILSGWDIRGISMSPNGDLALSISHKNNLEIYIMNSPFPDSIPENIASDITTHYRMVWSPDGRFLAYTPLQVGETSLWIWDGVRSYQIAHSPAGIGDISWSPDGKLAFVVFDTSSYRDEGDPSEAFIWDGETVVNLSQNPTGEDRFPTWNVDGRLAFISEREEIYDVFIWDGISMMNGVPDVSTFKNIAPYLTDYNSTPAWTNSGSITFSGSDISDNGFVQIYEWDGVNAVNLSQNPNSHNGGQRWRNDGHWSFHTYWSSEQLVYIRDETNETQLTLEGYGARWSESGYFILCQRTLSGTHWRFQEWKIPELIREYEGWTLLMGNGSKIIEVAQGDSIHATWSNGEAASCVDW
ncbi:hypothetical protein [Candidatus Leptofilum sp.]|uniref:hypothetical protein n=1 Tax=Candidatus Leptofilum sp. TaxID=3241576 RepID=UPI003B5A7218